MANGKKKTSMAKLNRETKMREKRSEKEARKEARKREAADDDSLRTDWFSLQGWNSPDGGWPSHLESRAPLYERRLIELRNNAVVRLIETPDFKRRWYKPNGKARIRDRSTSDP